ncbi:MAG: NADH-quinone oxidoreductase subunit L [Planctomycetota bacterium]
MLENAVYIPWIAALGAVLCGALCLTPSMKKLAGPICVLSILAGFGLTVVGFLNPTFENDQQQQVQAPWKTHGTYALDDVAIDPHSGKPIHADEYKHPAVVIQPQPWMHVGGTAVYEEVIDKKSGNPVLGKDGQPLEQIVGYEGGLQINYGYYFDGLTMVMLLVITGIGSLIAIYAVGYMKGDPGVARFFAAMALFIFAMTTLVMADNLVLLFLGWEGVGLCSYLLIGYYYGKDSAVAAAKKAFIVNRIGDFGFLIGIFLCYQHFGSTDFSVIFNHELLSRGGELPLGVLAIPFCLMVGAFGKSAQIPLFVWLPDAMAGPTPVSALVHAATMVTAGVYLIARMMPVFELVPSALAVVAVVGGVTALFAGTIALCSNDLKGVFAYSTVSQLGYMFLGLGALSTTGAVFHLVTHAFFKALLFLTAGSVMHALAGTLDIRTMGGLGKKMPVTKWLMFAGCLALAGVPFTAGFYSKDVIIAEAWTQGVYRDGGALYITLGVMALITALLTAFYTFRLWFIVFTGETKYEIGDEHHSEDDHGHDDHHAHEPHEMPWWPMNLPLVPLAIGSIVAGVLLYEYHVIGHLIKASSAYTGVKYDETIGTIMKFVSGGLAVAGITLAGWFYYKTSDRAEKAAELLKGPVGILRGKYFIDEFYDRVIVKPLFIAGQVAYLIDQLVIHATIMSFGWAPRLLGKTVQPTQAGKLHGYGLGMIAGVTAVALLLLFLL